MNRLKFYLKLRVYVLAFYDFFVAMQSALKISDITNDDANICKQE